MADICKETVRNRLKYILECEQPLSSSGHHRKRVRHIFGRIMKDAYSLRGGVGRFGRGLGGDGGMWRWVEKDLRLKYWKRVGSEIFDGTQGDKPLAN